MGQHNTVQSHLRTDYVFVVRPQLRKALCIRHGHVQTHTNDGCKRKTTKTCRDLRLCRCFLPDHAQTITPYDRGEDEAVKKSLAFQRPRQNRKRTGTRSFPDKHVRSFRGLYSLATMNSSSISKDREETTAKPEPQKTKEMNKKTRKKHRLDNTTTITTTGIIVDSASILSFPSEVLSILCCAYCRTTPSP